MKQGDIVVLPFPFTDLSDSKLRPALIVSNQTFNQKKNLILVAISTQKGDSTFSVPLKQTDLQTGALKKESFIRFQNLFTLEKRLIVKKVSTLKQDKLQEALQKIHSFL